MLSFVGNPAPSAASPVQTAVPSADIETPQRFLATGADAGVSGWGAGLGGALASAG
eukprot:CAMPEP_0115613864 /NCGR_PEP_ID=MMETSP0272-20121206/21809_1 /TAXON_ID=71861 /ORGANISM="Scrippsiella trochoidea, Strain CCMP3099" /LENGTH=55 /DNA_ID=CAMNT_0003049723 /DNA_START=62 /DNA_END=225 /DNA_ORIENTATION=+